MPDIPNAALHDAYAEGYDQQIKAYDCHVADLLFGLCYDHVLPGQRLLDAGIGSGLSSELFAKAGVEIHGMDFSPVMLRLCAAKAFAAGLQQHDLEDVPWPYESRRFDHVVCCGVLHFVADLDALFAEAGRVLGPRGNFAFTTRAPVHDGEAERQHEMDLVGEFSIFSHRPAYIDGLLARHGFERRKLQRSYVGDDLFFLLVAQKRN